MKVRPPRKTIVVAPPKARMSIKRQAEELVLKTAREFIAWPDNVDRRDNLRSALTILDMVTK